MKGVRTLRTKFRITFSLTVDRDVYPLPISEDDHAEEIETVLRDALFDIDGMTVTNVRVKQD